MSLFTAQKTNTRMPTLHRVNDELAEVLVLANTYRKVLFEEGSFI